MSGWVATKGKLCEDVGREQGAAERNRNTQERTRTVKEVQSKVAQR